MSGTANSIPGLQPVEVAPQARSAPPRRPGSRTSLGLGNRMQFGDHLDGAVLQFALTSRPAHRRTSCCRTCMASRRAGPDPRRSPSGRTACRAPSPSPRASAPAARGCRSSRRPAGSRRTDGPCGRTRTRGRPAAVGATRATHFSSRLPAVLVPAAGQDDRLRRHAVGVDAAFHGDLGRYPAGHHCRQPPRQHVGQRADVTTRVLESADVLDSRFVAIRILPSAGNYDTVGSDMKADASAVDKTRRRAAPGPSNRRCHTARDGGSACGNRIFEPDDGGGRRACRHHQDRAVPAVVQQGRTGARGGVPRGAHRHRDAAAATSPPTSGR